ncbi:hypothetical protein P2G88_02720 [Aliiglaciecola sp. CAU 1673]|uniref:hypothetical protein n=1 Tax=Aliiglaciecola sp. CAU 1673 TaxID=3032595 RepID=UPI0023DB6D4F|nr:hypothetical protein [Aliiglaciecola sp. CAU 1673]MDF2177157.1 hypothetical protein [Aliiglaciecola sp. CAU 1673]
MTKPLSIFAAMMIATTAQLWAPSLMAEQSTSNLEEVRKETEELMQAIKAYSAEQKEQAIAKTAEALEKLDERIDKLDKQLAEQWQDLDESTRQERQAFLDKLKVQRAELADWLAKMKDSSSGAWGELKAGFADAYEKLAEAWEKAKEKF